MPQLGVCQIAQQLCNETITNFSSTKMTSFDHVGLHAFLMQLLLLLSSREIERAKGHYNIPLCITFFFYDCNLACHVSLTPLSSLSLSSNNPCQIVVYVVAVAIQQPAVAFHTRCQKSEKGGNATFG